MSSLLFNLTQHAMAPKNCIFELYHPMIIEEFDYIDYILILISKYTFLFDTIIIILLYSIICYQIFYLDFERINEIENLQRKNKLLEEELNLSTLKRIQIRIQKRRKKGLIFRHRHLKIENLQRKNKLLEDKLNLLFK